MILCYEHRKLNGWAIFFWGPYIFATPLSETSLSGMTSSNISGNASLRSSETGEIDLALYLITSILECPHFSMTEFSLALPAINVTTVQNHIVFAALYTSILYYVVLYSGWYIVYWITIINFIFIGERKIFNQITI